MKKSRSVRLVVLGSASIALAACGDDAPPNDARFFSNLQECAAVYDRAQCLDAKTSAEQTFIAEAPKYSRKEQCETDFGAGNCESQQASAGTQQASAGSGEGSFFMPMLMGYMMGNMLSGQSRFNQPVYRGPENLAMTQNRGKMFNIGSFGGAGRADASAFRPAAQVAQVQRGGFGSTATAHRTSAGS